MSITRTHIYAAAPQTTRGFSLCLGEDLKHGRQFLYSCGNALYIRNLDDPLVCDQFIEQSARVTCASWSPNGFWIATGDETGHVRIWDPIGEERITRLHIPALGLEVKDIQWSGDSKRVLAVGNSREMFGRVFMWDTGASIGEIVNHSKTVNACAFRPSRPFRVVTGGDDCTANWFKGPPFRFEKRLSGQHDRFITGMRFSRNGEVLLTAGMDHRLFLYDGKTGDLQREITHADGHGSGIYAFAWNADSTQFVTASADRTCKVWDLETGAVVSTLHVSAAPKVDDQQVGVLWSGNFLVSASLSGDLNYWDPSAPERPTRVITGHSKSVSGLALDRAAGRFYSSSYDGRVVGWDVATGLGVRAGGGKAHTTEVTALSLVPGSAGGASVLASADRSGRVLGTPAAALDYAEPKETSVGDVPVSIAQKPGTALSAVVSWGKISLVQDGASVAEMPTPYRALSAVWLTDPDRLIVGGSDNAVHVYTISGTDIEESTVLPKLRGQVTVLSVSPDGTHVAAGDAVGTIRVYTVSTWAKCVEDWTYHTASVTTLAWRSDNKHIISGSVDTHLYLWSIQDPAKKVKHSCAHFGGVRVAAWLDDTTVLSAGQQGAIKRWQVSFAD